MLRSHDGDIFSLLAVFCSISPVFKVPVGMLQPACLATQVQTPPPTQTSSTRTSHGCHAITVDEVEGVGRVALAARDLKAGEVILRDTPCVWGPRYVAGKGRPLLEPHIISLDK